MRRPLLSMIVLASFALAGCGPVFAGPPEDRSVDRGEEPGLPSASRLHVSGAMEVELRQRDEPSVELSGPRDVVRDVDVSVADDVLRIQPPRRRGILFGNAPEIRAEVALPALHGVTAGGASSVTVHDDLWVGDDDGAVVLDATGASTIRVDGTALGEELAVRGSGSSDVRAEVDVSDVGIELSGASTAEIAGAADDLRLEASGASDADLEWLGGLTTGIVTASGASEVGLGDLEQLDVTASGASTVIYAGQPRMQSQETGASTVERR